MRRAGITLAAVTLVALLIAGCGSSTEGNRRVVATTAIMTQIAQRVAGERLRVQQLIPEGASPHDFQLSARERALMGGAELVVANGGGLEAALALGSLRKQPYELIDHVGPLIRTGAGSQPDPHVWMDPLRVARALPSIASKLSALDPAGADGYRRRARAYAGELEAIDRRMSSILSSVPKGDRELVTSHDALAYFAEAFDFLVVATPFPSTGPEAEASAASVDEVERTIERTGVPAVFPETESNPAVLRGIAERTGVLVIPGLRVESPGPAGYPAMLIADSRLIAGGLSR